MDSHQITVDATAAWLRTSPYSVWKWIHRGDLTATRVSGRWQIDPASVEAFLARHTVPAGIRSQ